MTTTDSSRRPDFWRMGLFIFLGVLALSIPQAALLPLLDRDEPRFAEASREMRQSGNFVVPTFNGAPRYAKPPLIYWMQAASFCVLGENRFAARLPSLLATAGTAVLLFCWGADLAGTAAGMIAALSYAFCFQAMQQGRVATADALLVFFVALTGLAGWRLLGLATEGSSRSWRLWGMALALAIAGGFLAKGPEALLPMVPIFWTARGSGGRLLWALAAILALGLFVVAWWAVPAFAETHGAYWREGLQHDVGDRMISGFQGHGASSLGLYLLLLPLYFLTFWISALPWSPLLVIFRRRLFAAWVPDGAEVYLLQNAALFFVIFSLMVTKLPHYTLPAFPFLALIFAKRWVGGGLRVGLPAGLGWGMGGVLALVALFVIPVVVVPLANPSPVGRLVREAGSSLTPGTEFALVDFQEPNAIWEMRRVVRGEARMISADGVAEFLREPGGRAVVMTAEGWARCRPVGVDAARLKVFSARGWNAAKGTFLDLTLVVEAAGGETVTELPHWPNFQRGGLRRREDGASGETGFWDAERRRIQCCHQLRLPAVIDRRYKGDSVARRSTATF